MGQVLVRGLEDAVIERLKKRADVHHRSLEAELREILGQAARYLDEETALELTDKFRQKLQGQSPSDSAELIREDRDR